MHSVIKAWVFMQPYRMQSVMMSSVRGCDIARKDDPSKFITRAIRGLVFNNADPSNTFITDGGVPDDEHVKRYLWDMDSYPLHFVMHTAHAAEIIGYKYASGLDPRVADTDAEQHKIRGWWLGFYRNVAKSLHVNPETEEQLDVRLGSTPDERKMRDIPSLDLLAAFQAALIGNEAAFAQHLAKHGFGAAVTEVEEEEKRKQKWNAGTGTSHGGRQRPYSGNS